MSTRANILILDGFEQLWFYRHSDGYPSGALPTLFTFMNWVKEGKIRDNVGQAAGWLILLGAKEYGDIFDWDTKTRVNKVTLFEPGSKDDGMGWKAGAYEPTTGRHSDIEFLYELDLKKKEIRVFNVGMDQDTRISVYYSFTPQDLENVLTAEDSPRIAIPGGQAKLDRIKSLFFLDPKQRIRKEDKKTYYTLQKRGSFCVVLSEKRNRVLRSINLASPTQDDLNFISQLRID